MAYRIIYGSSGTRNLDGKPGYGFLQMPQVPEIERFAGDQLRALCGDLYGESELGGRLNPAQGAPTWLSSPEVAWYRPAQPGWRWGLLCRTRPIQDETGRSYFLTEFLAVDDADVRALASRGWTPADLLVRSVMVSGKPLWWVESQAAPPVKWLAADAGRLDWPSASLQERGASWGSVTGTASPLAPFTHASCVWMAQKSAGFGPEELLLLMGESLRSLYHESLADAWSQVSFTNFALRRDFAGGTGRFQWSGLWHGTPYHEELLRGAGNVPRLDLAHPASLPREGTVTETELIRAGWMEPDETENAAASHPAASAAALSEASSPRPVTLDAPRGGRRRRSEGIGAQWIWLAVAAVAVLAVALGVLVSSAFREKPEIVAVPAPPAPVPVRPPAPPVAPAPPPPKTTVTSPTVPPVPAVVPDSAPPTVPAPAPPPVAPVAAAPSVHLILGTSATRFSVGADLIPANAKGVLAGGDPVGLVTKGPGSSREAFVRVGDGLVRPTEGSLAKLDDVGVLVLESGFTAPAMLEVTSESPVRRLLLLPGPEWKLSLGPADLRKFLDSGALPEPWNALTLPEGPGVVREIRFTWKAETGLAPMKPLVVGGAGPVKEEVMEQFNHLVVNQRNAFDSELPAAKIAEEKARKEAGPEVNPDEVLKALEVFEKQFVQVDCLRGLQRFQWGAPQLAVGSQFYAWNLEPIAVEGGLGRSFQQFAEGREGQVTTVSELLAGFHNEQTNAFLNLVTQKPIDAEDPEFSKSAPKAKAKSLGKVILVSESAWRALADLQKAGAGQTQREKMHALLDDAVAELRKQGHPGFEVDQDGLRKELANGEVPPQQMDGYSQAISRVMVGYAEQLAENRKILATNLEQYKAASQGTEALWQAEQSKDYQIPGGIRLGPGILGKWAEEMRKRAGEKARLSAGPATTGPVAVMEANQKRIEKALGEIREALEKGDAEHAGWRFLQDAALLVRRTEPGNG